MIAPRRFTELAAAGAAALFLLSWAVLHTGWYDDREIVDIPVYASYGTKIEDGAVPYRDIRPEYPPGALPAFVVPALLSDDEQGFRNVFEDLMALFGVAVVLLAAVALRGLGASRERTVAALALVAGFPLLLGSVVLTRFDLYPAALVAAAIAALVHRRDRLGLRPPRCGRGGEALSGRARPDRDRLRVAPPRPPRGARLSGAVRRGGRARVRPLPRRRTRRRRTQPRAAAVAAAPDREPRLRALPRSPPPRRARRRDALRPRLAEPLCDGNGGDCSPAQPRPDRGARVDLAAAAGHERGARSLERRGPGRLRRAGEGAVAAVPDLARAGRPARRRSSRSCGRRCCSRLRSY